MNEVRAPPDPDPTIPDPKKIVPVVIGQTIPIETWLRFNLTTKG